MFITRLATYHQNKVAAFVEEAAIFVALKDAHIEAVEGVLTLASTGDVSSTKVACWRDDWNRLKLDVTADSSEVTRILGIEEVAKNYKEAQSSLFSQFGESVARLVRGRVNEVDLRRLQDQKLVAI